MSISHLGHAGRMVALDATLARKAESLSLRLVLLRLDRLADALAAYKHVEEEFEDYRIPTYRPAAGESPVRCSGAGLAGFLPHRFHA